MTHNVKLISERTDIKFSISYFPEKEIFLFSLLYRQMKLAYFKENNI